MRYCNIHLHGADITELHATQLAAEAGANVLRTNGFNVTLTPPPSTGLSPLEYSPV